MNSFLFSFFGWDLGYLPSSPPFLIFRRVCCPPARRSPSRLRCFFSFSLRGGQARRFLDGVPRFPQYPFVSHFPGNISYLSLVPSPKLFFSQYGGKPFVMPLVADFSLSGLDAPPFQSPCISMGVSVSASLIFKTFHSASSCYAVYRAPGFLLDHFCASFLRVRLF